MDFEDLDAIALQVFDEADEDPERPPTMFDLARALHHRIERAPHLVTPGCFGRVGGKFVILVKSSLSDERAQHVAGHEISHIWLRQHGVVVDDEEAACDYLSAALLAPRPYVMKLYRAEGFAPAVMAAELLCSQTCAALRISEATGIHAATVTPAAVRVRGRGEFYWGTADDIRRRARARFPGPGLARIRLTDERGRLALVVQDEESSETG